MWCPHYPMLHELLGKQPNGLVLDVGSFDGSDAIVFARAGHRVWSFEPSPGKVEPIRRRIKSKLSARQAANVTLYPWALSNATGTAAFVVNKAGNKANRMFRGQLGSAQDSLGAPLWTLDNATTVVVEVPVRRIDDIVPSNHSVLLLKVDAQGYDHHVLLGARQLLTQKRVSVVVAELSPLLMPGGFAAAAEMVRYLHALGYQCTRCCECPETCCGSGTKARSSIPAIQYAADLGAVDKGVTIRGGVNVGRWDDLVCLPSTLASGQSAANGPHRRHTRR